MNGNIVFRVVCQQTSRVFVYGSCQYNNWNPSTNLCKNACLYLGIIESISDTQKTFSSLNPFVCAN